MTAISNAQEYQACIRCIMDSVADRSIAFDVHGLCNHCRRYDELRARRVLQGREGRQALDTLLKRVRTSGKGLEHDCIVGVSGGVDSTYVAYVVKQYGLRPLAIHFDNGWNSELAVKNIEQVLRNLDIELYTYVVDWEEFKDLQLSFLYASVPDGEVPTDHGINALLWREASARGLKYIISGMNFATESISVPDWAYGHSDWRYIKDVHRRHGRARLTTYPHFSLSYLLYVTAIRGVHTISILNYLDYDKEAAKKVLCNELGWKDYGGKHHESIYTRFYQGYLLPKKFGIDKRYGHLSDLINSGQLSRATAIEDIRREPYSEDLQLQDVEYVRKKLGLSMQDFDSIMRAPPASFRSYRNNYRLVQRLKTTVNALRGIGAYPR